MTHITEIPGFRAMVNQKQIAENTNNYLKKDDGDLQYNWVCQPNCTELGL